jgi:O-acetyl-ADP-ribose deacetylase (regulator of RNase III)
MVGDLFNTQCQTILHNANNLGVMGAGFAKQLKEKYPENFEYYKSQCSISHGGDVIFWNGRILGKPKSIFNLIGQTQLGPHARLDFIKMGLIRTKVICDKFRIQSLAMPLIGTGIGRLNWNDVEKLVKTELDSENIYIEIYSR